MSLIHPFNPTLVVTVGISGFLVCVLLAVAFAVSQIRETSRIIRRAGEFETPAAEPDWADGLTDLSWE